MLKHITLLLLPIFLLAECLQGQAISGPPESTKKHHWHRIYYNLDDDDSDLSNIIFSLNPQDWGLSLWMSQYGDSKRPSLEFSTRIILENGSVIMPMVKNPIKVGGAVGHSPDHLQWNWGAQFPWASNELLATWIEIDLGEKRFLLELPYGFFQNPSAPLPESHKEEPPKLPSSITESGKPPHIRLWHAIQYEIESIAEGFISLERNKKSHTSFDLTLVTNNGSYINPSHSPKKDAPKISLEIQEPDQAGMNGYLIDQKMNAFEMRRTDTFNFEQSKLKRRSWGKMHIKIDDSQYDLWIPSSIYR